MKIIIIILAVLGTFKLISFIITCLIELYYKFYHYKVPSSKEFIQIDRTSGIYKTEYFVLIPTISVDFICGLEIIVKFLNFEYYTFYKLEFEDDN